MDIFRRLVRSDFVIPVSLAAEPPDFNVNVRQPGSVFLARVANPNSNEWNSHSYWSSALGDLHVAYNDVCAYCGSFTLRAPAQSLESSSVDHFIPKSADPDNAYEWDNYRLCRARLNQLKDNHQDVLDPFELPQGWFHLDFRTFLIWPNPGLDQNDQQRVKATIGRLRLNLAPDYVDERLRVVRAYCLKKATFPDLSRRYPFIASEMTRQNFDSDLFPTMAARFKGSD